MRKINDRVTLGAISGILAGIPDTVINAAERHAGLTDLTYGQMGANLFLPRGKEKPAEAQLAGYLANIVLTGLSGVAFTYLLSSTGRDRALLKGIGFGLVTWAAIYGLGARMGLQVEAKKPLAPLLSFIDHIIFGSLLGLITPRLAGDTIFPGGERVSPAAGEKADALPKDIEDTREWPRDDTDHLNYC